MHLLKWFGVTAIIMGPNAAPAIEPTHAVVSAGPPAPACIPDATRLDGICGDIYQKTQDFSSRNYYAYAYERKIYEASCVDFQKDTPNEARGKIQKLFREEMGKALACNAANFQVARGSILKYAIEMRTLNFIQNAAKDWKVDLNYVDESDRRTLIDFIELKIFQNMGAPYEQTLRGYYADLRERGARHCYEVSTSCSTKGNEPKHKAFLKEMEDFNRFKPR